MNKKHVSSRYVIASEARMDVKQVSYVEHMCGVNRQAMKLIGLWPQERKFNRISNYVVLFPISMMVLFMVVPQTINLYFVWGNFNLIVENLSVANITVTIAVMKTIIFWMSGKSLKILLSEIEKDRRETVIEKEVIRMTRIAKICRTLSLGSIILSEILVFLEVLRRLLIIRSNGRGLILQSYFPYDVLVTPKYEITLVCQIMGGICTAGTYSTIDTFLAMTVLHTCGQFSNLRDKLRNLHPGKEFRVKLTQIIKKHVALRRSVDMIEEQFSGMLLCQIVGCTLQICVQCFQAILSLIGEKHGDFLMQITFLFLYIIYVLVQLYLYCYIGERLLSESMEVVQAAYECNWYELSSNEARCLVIIMRRAQLPLQITAGKFCSLSHELFSTILKTSMSYLSVLYAMKNKDE